MTPAATSLVTRRLFLALAAGSPVFANSSPAPSSTRAYIADATLLLFSRPTLTRTNVGGGWCGIESLPSGRTRLVFAGGSLPERARGMHWLGQFEELLGQPEGPSYFGFMSTQKGATGVQAGHSGSQRDSCWYKVSRAAYREGAWRAAIREVPMPATHGFRQCGLVAAHVREQIPAEPDSQFPDDQPRTLLASILEARRANHLSAFETRYFANGKTYQLAIQRRREHDLLRLDGLVRDLAGNRKGQFRAWFAHDDLPVRIEYQPRPYLQLTLRLPQSGEAAPPQEAE